MANGKTLPERLSMLEQKVTDLALTINEIKGDVKEIKAGMVSIIDFDKRLKRLEYSSNIWKWMSPTLAAVLGSVLTFLIISYLGGK